jgi:hypothetical protein
MLVIFLWRKIEYYEESHRLKDPSKEEGTEENTEKTRQVYDRILSPEYRPKINTK